MIRATDPRLLFLLGAAACAWSTDRVVVGFEKAVPLVSDGNANRVPRWEEKGVVFTLAHEPRQTKGKGLLLFFTHLSSGHKGIVCALATEPIPARFPAPVSSVEISCWASTGVPAALEAFDADGKMVDRASLESVTECAASALDATGGRMRIASCRR